MVNIQVLLLWLVTVSSSKVDVNKMFSETYFEINTLLKGVGKRFPEQPTEFDRCEQNSECKRVNSFCDRFFSLVDNSTNTYKYEASFCIEKPTLEPHTELALNSSGIGIRRCQNNFFCEYDESCLAVNGERQMDGFCVKLNFCSNNRRSSLVQGYVPCEGNLCTEHFKRHFGHKWHCVNYTTSDDFRFLHSTSVLQINRTISACCLEREPGLCKHGDLMKPARKCVRNKDCFTVAHEPTEWCDEITNFCCNDASQNKTLRCPDGLMYPFVEAVCHDYDDSIPTSGNCSLEDTNASCLFGHCCPHGSFDEGEFVEYNTTLETGIPCALNEPLRRMQWAFCDPLTRFIVILQRDLYEKQRNAVSNRAQCRSNFDCPLNDTTVCVWDSKYEYGECMMNPFAVLPGAMGSEKAYSLFIFSVISTFVCFCFTLYFDRKITRFTKDESEKR